MPTPPLRVLHCAAGNLYGGIETMLATLARQRALNPALEPSFALAFEGRLSAELDAEGVPVRLIGPARLSRPWTVARARRGLRRLLTDHPADVVVCHGCWTHLVFGPAARRCGCPLVFWMHDLARGSHWLEWGAARTPPDLVLANSRCTAATLPRLFPQAPSAVLHCPVEPPHIDQAAARASLRDELATPADAVVVVLASRLERWKGHAVLLDALGRLRHRPGWVAWIAGGVQRPVERTYLDALQTSARAAGIADRVQFLGHRSDVPRLLAAADIHCQPNTGPEPFGVAFVEGLYAGRPVVATHLGGAVEIVDDSCGVLVLPGDAEALAAALGRLIDDPGERARLGAAGPARARALCDPGETLARLEVLLRSMRSGQQHQPDAPARDVSKAWWNGRDLAQDLAGASGSCGEGA
jgi:glycosyltransferase involved in cell wall biosynthesis